MKKSFMQSEPYLSAWNHDDAGEQSKKDLLLEMWKEQAKLYGIDPLKIKIEKQRMEPNQKTVLEPSDPADDEIDAIKAAIQKVMAKDTDCTPKSYESRLVDNEEELMSCIQNGWEVLRELNSGKVLLRRGISKDGIGIPQHSD